MSKRYLIIENNDLLDGNWYTAETLGSGIAIADYDAIILEFDLSEVTTDKATPLRDVTEDVVRDWWHREGLSTTMDRIEAGYSAPQLASRFFNDSVSAHTALVEAA